MTLPVNEASVIFGEIVSIEPNDRWKGYVVAVNVCSNLGKDKTMEGLAAIEFGDYHDKSVEALSVGDKVQVGYIHKGREWTSPAGERKFFNTLSGKSIKRMEAPKTNRAESPKGLNFSDPANQAPF